MIGDQLGRMVAARAGGDKGEIRDAALHACFNNARNLVALQDVVHLRGPRKILCESRQIGSAEDGVEGGLAQVGIHEQNRIVLVARQAHRQIYCDKALSIRRHAAADENRLERSLIAKLVDLRAQATKLLDAFAAVSQRRKCAHRGIPRIPGDFIEKDVLLDRWQFLRALGGLVAFTLTVEFADDRRKEK